MHHIYISQSHNPYFNVALEKSLMKKHREGVTLFLWQNKSSVFIGRNQNLYAECNLDMLKEYNVLPVRRYSGGGAVYQDEGNLNFSFICKDIYFDEIKIRDVIIETLKCLGIESEFNGRNDLLFHGRKISGQAYFQEDDMYLYHGTLLVDVNIELMNKILVPSKLKLQSKGISSIRSRVINLRDYYPDLNMDQLIDSFIKIFHKVFTHSNQIIKIKENDLIDYSQLESKEWIYGQSPRWNVKIEKKLTIGNIEALVFIRDGFIEDVSIYTDSLLNVNFDKCEEKLKNKWFDEKKILDIIMNNMVI